MPKAWTTAIEHSIARIAALRDEVASLVAQNASVVASVPAATEPDDPRPLIADAVTPLAQRLASFEGVIRNLADRTDQLSAAQSELAARPIPEPTRELLTVLRAISRILAVRLLLFLSLAGSFSLAVMAMLQQSWLSLALVVAFALLTVGPLAYLEVAGKARAEAT